MLKVKCGQTAFCQLIMKIARYVWPACDAATAMISCSRDGERDEDCVSFGHFLCFCLQFTFNAASNLPCCCYCHCRCWCYCCCCCCFSCCCGFLLRLRHLLLLRLLLLLLLLSASSQQLGCVARVSGLLHVGMQQQQQLSCLVCNLQ